MRTNFDFTPYRRSSVGFDRLFDLLETSARGNGVDGYPPFDIERQDEDIYRITLAVAGFRPEEIEIIAHQNELIVSGKRTDDGDNRQYLHRGILARPFERRFELADFIVIESASFDNGLLSIALKRIVPEAMKPRKIEISGSVSTNDRLEPPEDDHQQAA